LLHENPKRHQWPEFDKTIEASWLYDSIRSILKQGNQQIKNSYCPRPAIILQKNIIGKKSLTDTLQKTPAIMPGKNSFMERSVVFLIWILNFCSSVILDITKLAHHNKRLHLPLNSLLARVLTFFDCVVLPALAYGCRIFRCRVAAPGRQ
jgi:hypothetical protein